MRRDKAYTIERVKKDHVARRSRKSESAFEKSRVWQDMKRDLDAGPLKPTEALQVSFYPEYLEELGLTNKRTVARFIKKYVKASGQKYAVTVFNKDGMIYIQVADTTPVAFKHPA